MHKHFIYILTSEQISLKLTVLYDREREREREICFQCSQKSLQTDVYFTVIIQLSALGFSHHLKETNQFNQPRRSNFTVFCWALRPWIISRSIALLFATIVFSSWLWHIPILLRFYESEGRVPLISKQQELV